MTVPYLEERTYHPDGCDPDDINAFSFQVGVYYRGRGKWAVATSRECHQQLSQTGRWLWFPLKMTAMRWCRFTFDEACRLAEEHRNSRVVNGRTWAQWQELDRNRRKDTP